MSEYELGQESRREFCVRHGLATSTLDYWRRRSRGDGGERLVEVEIEVDVEIEVENEIEVDVETQKKVSKNKFRNLF